MCLAYVTLRWGFPHTWVNRSSGGFPHTLVNNQRQSSTATNAASTHFVHTYYVVIATKYSKYIKLFYNSILVLLIVILESSNLRFFLDTLVLLCKNQFIQSQGQDNIFTRLSKCNASHTKLLLLYQWYKWVSYLIPQSLKGRDWAFNMSSFIEQNARVCYLWQRKPCYLYLT